jgi:ABC-2 type transport system permease protein
MRSFKALWGVLRYEYTMQIRRPALWLTFLGLTLLMLRIVLSTASDPERLPLRSSTLSLAVVFTGILNILAPLAVGIFLADRLPRDRRTRVEELLNTMPEAPGLRVLGKYLGSTLATLTPAFALYMVSMVAVAYVFQNPLVLLAALLCYVVIVLPGMLFIAAFSLACPAVIWVPLYQFLFFGYWFWGNLLSPNTGLPTLSGTILTPIGGFISRGLFGVSSVGFAKEGTQAEGIASLLALLGIAVLVLVVLERLLSWYQARQ